MSHSCFKNIHWLSAYTQAKHLSMVSSHALLLIVPLRLNPTDTSPTVNFTAFPYNKVPSRRFCNCFCTYRCMAWNALTATLLLWQHLLIPSLRQMPPPLCQWPRPGVWWAVAFSLTLQHYYPFMAPVILHRDRVCLSAPSVVLGMTPFQAIAELPPPLPSASSIALGSQGCSEWRGAGVGEDCEWSVFRTDCTPRAWTPRQALVDCPELPWLYWLPQLRVS